MLNTIEEEVPEFVAEYLEPIPGDSPQGSDVEADLDFTNIKNVELAKKNSPDYQTWLDLSNTILKEKSKDLRVASWLLLPLYKTEKIKGLKNGLYILVQLLKKYGNDLFPLNPQQKKNAIQFIASDRVIEFLSKDKIDTPDYQHIIIAEKLLTEIDNECKKIIPENFPDLKRLSKVISDLIKSAVPQPKTEVKKVDNKNEQPKEPNTPIQTIKTQSPIFTEKEGIAQLRKIISAFFEKEEDGIKKERVPENSFVFGLSRQIQWSMLTRPIDTAGVTLIEAPPGLFQTKMKELFENNDLDTLISRVEIQFIKETSDYRYWMDAQRYLVKSLEIKGGTYQSAAADIKFHLSKLLLRIPDLPDLKFKDKKTPFADADTISWINDNVKNIFGSNGTKNKNSIPSIISEDFKDINREYEAACNDIPENFDKNLSGMQSDLLSEEHIKGKFLRRLNLANFLMLHHEYQPARVHLLELKETITLNNLAGWEKALCTSVWRSLYLCNQEILQHSKNDNLKHKLEAEQEELYNELAKYDVVLAIQLTKTKKSWR